jgi:subtilisin-like proprotein convertase family protein
MKSKIVLQVLFLSLSFLFIRDLYAQRYWNVAANFNGTNYISVGQWPPLRDLSGSFTVECWINCSQSAGTVFGKTGIRLMTENVGANNYRMRLQTNNNTKLYSRYNAPLQKNYWYHVACTYDSTGPGIMQFYINGSSDTSRTGTDLGPDPGTVSDSLIIGKSSSYGYHVGMIDDIRIWDRPLSLSEIQQNRRNPYVGIMGYNGPDNPNFGAGLVLSSPFDFTYTGPGNQLYFYDGYNGYVNNGATYVNLGNNPSVTLSTNNALQLNGTTNYVRMTQSADINFTAPVTVEAWINPVNSVSPNNQYIVRKGSDYYMYLDNTGKLKFGFHAVGSSYAVIPSGQWTHVAIKCEPAGSGTLYLNGKYESSFNFGSQPAAGTDTLFIGASSSTLGFFNGYIDAVKISNYVKTEKQILNEMFVIVDNSNKPAAPNSTVSLNFDFQNYSSSFIGGYYYFRNGAKYTSAGYTNDVPVSPMLGNNISNFPNGYIMKYSGRNIPESGTAGYMKVDSLNVSTNAVISDLKLFLALNHTSNTDLQIKLIAPNGDSLIVYDRQYGLNTLSDHIITVFEDGADSTLVSGKYVSFDPRIKPANSLNSFFSGKNSQGIWKLRITDFTNGNTGVLYGWGLRINNSVGIQQISGNVPDKFSLSQNYPNPFNPVTNINYSLSKSGLVRITVFDILGKEIETLVNENLSPGTYSVTFNAGKYSSGIYFYRMKTEGFTDVKKMILLK